MEIRNQSSRNSASGFTLLELMIVVAIIGVLVAIALPQFFRFSAKSKRAEGIILLKGFYTAELSYFGVSGVYVHDGGTPSGPPPKLGFAAASTPKYYNLSQMFTLTGDFTGDGPHDSFGAFLEGQLDQDATMDGLIIGTQTAPIISYTTPGEVSIPAGQDDVNL